MKTDYTIKENRIRALDAINDTCIKKLREAGVELHKNTSCSVSEQNVEIGIKKPKDKFISMSSTINFYPKYYPLGNEKECKINFGTSGSFTCKDEIPYWRTVTAASILKNWKKACQVIEKCCKDYRELIKEMEAQLKATE